jgi:hypothetical protein
VEAWERYALEAAEAGAGHYRADWFLRFMGLESFPVYRKGGRLQNYRGQPPLSEGAFRALQGLVKNAAEDLGRSDAGHSPPGRLDERAGTLLALSSFRLEDLASPEASGQISRAVSRLT